MNDSKRSCWTKFWFSPAPVSDLTFVRRSLCIITALYFVSAMVDVDTWFSKGAPASSSNLATFFRTSELASDTRWMLSPLFLWDAIFADSSLGESAGVYRIYLLFGVLLAGWTAVVDRFAPKNLPRFAAVLCCESGPAVLLWIWLIGWANRIVMLGGIVEPLLSLSLAALAIAPITPLSPANRDRGRTVLSSWRSGLSMQLLAVQATLIAILTSATMLASSVWWNGSGAYALVAPAEDRFIVATGTFFARPIVFETVTLLMVVVLPIGIMLAWKRTTHRLGIALVVGWCAVVALLSANVLYAATLAVISTTIGAARGCDPQTPTPAGANGAETLNGGSVDRFR